MNNSHTMEVAQRLLQILTTYQENSELISKAVNDLRRIEGELEGLTILRQGYEERNRQRILKAVALLAPSDIPAKVIEVDGVDDAELAVCQAKGWLDSALSTYLRHESTYSALAKACEAEFGEAVGCYANSVMTAVCDHIDLGDECLTEFVKPSPYDCVDSGRQLLENARMLCRTAYLPPFGGSVRCDVLAFEAVKDNHRRFALITAILVESATGKVMFYDRGTIQISDIYTLGVASHSGLKFNLVVTGDSADDSRTWASLAVLCSMFAEVHKQLPTSKGCELVNSIVCRLDFGLEACKEKLDTLVEDQLTTWIPSRNDLKLIHTCNDESTRTRLHRSFMAREALIEGLKKSPTPVTPRPAKRIWALDCLADRKWSQLGHWIVKAYEEQPIMEVQSEQSVNSSIFATYIYNSLGRSVVAELHRDIFSSRKVNIRKANSGTLIFVPHSGLVTMTTHGMVCETVKVTNSQVFGYDNASRFVLLPHLLEILGLRQDDALLATLIREIDNNAYLVADPLTSDVRACMTRSFEEANREFRVSTLHEEALRTAGEEHFRDLVREAVSLLVRLGAKVPHNYVNRSCFYDITRDLKQYRDASDRIHLLFDRGVTLDGLRCDVSQNKTLVILHTQHEEAFIIAPIDMEKNLRKRPPPDDTEEFHAMEAAITEAGLVMTKPVYEVHGELHITATRSDPGRGILSLFNGCEAR